MNAPLARQNGEFDVVSRKPDAIVSDILCMVTSVAQERVHVVLKTMTLPELNIAYKRAVEARAGAGQGVMQRAEAAGKAILAMPHLVQT